jgi:hypothetical protein
MAQTNPLLLGETIQYQLENIVTPTPVYAAFNRNFATQPNFLVWMLRNIHQPVYTGQTQSNKGIDTPVFQISVFSQNIATGFTISNHIMQALHDMDLQHVQQRGKSSPNCAGLHHVHSKLIRH